MKETDGMSSPESQPESPDSSLHTPDPEAGAKVDMPGGRTVWPQFRKLLVFQVKLYLDALRDLLMSPLSVVAFLLDVVQGNHGRQAHFESLLKFGRKTEQAINLFNQHDVDDENHRGIDTILMQVEDAVRREYSDGSVSASARESIENSLTRLRGRLRQNRQEDQQ